MYDHCGRPRVAVSQLAELLPELGPGGTSGAPPTTIRTLGVLDGAGLTRTDSDADLEVRHTLAEAMVPVAAIDSNHLVQPLQRAQVQYEKDRTAAPATKAGRCGTKLFTVHLLSVFSRRWWWCSSAWSGGASWW